MSKSIITSTQMETPDRSVAKAIDSLTDKGTSLPMMSNLSENDVPRLAVMLTIGNDPDMNATFLRDLAHQELALMCSVVMKRAGVRSEQVVEVAKAPPMLADTGGGIMDKIRGRLRR